MVRYASALIPKAAGAHRSGGDKAKLNWPVSIDGKKMESETYKILAVLAKN